MNQFLFYFFMAFISNNSRIPLLCLYVCFITVRCNHLHIYSFVPLELLYGQIIWRCAVGYERKGIKLCLRLIYHDIMILFKRNWTPFGKQEVLKCVRQLRPHRVEFAWGCLLPGNRESNGKHFEQRGDGQFPGALSGTGVLQSQRNPHSLNTEKLELYTLHVHRYACCFDWEQVAFSVWDAVEKVWHVA